MDLRSKLTSVRRISRYPLTLSVVVLLAAGAVVGAVSQAGAGHADSPSRSLACPPGTLIIEMDAVLADDAPGGPGTPQVAASEFLHDTYPDLALDGLRRTESADGEAEFVLEQGAGPQLSLSIVRMGDSWHVTRMSACDALLDAPVESP